MQSVLGVAPVFDKDNAAVTYVRGNRNNAGSFKTIDNFSAVVRVAFTGEDLTLTLGTGPDHSLVDVYIDNSLWESVDLYAAASSERAIPILLATSGTHTLEVRNRAEKNLALLPISYDSSR